VLRADPNIEVAGDAAGAEDLLALAASLQPDVILIELETAADDLVVAVWQLVEEAQGFSVVLLCDAEDRWTQSVLRAGVRGILPRDASGSKIAAAVIAAGLGLVVLNPATFQAALPAESAALHASVTAELAEALTPRETEVLTLLTEGLGNKVISRRLGISEHTVKFHVGAIMAKLRATSRTEAVTIAARRGLIML
jgi:DNA-binding NarL/FixJ family response regulator